MWRSFFSGDGSLNLGQFLAFSVCAGVFKRNVELPVISVSRKETKVPRRPLLVVSVIIYVLIIFFKKMSSLLENCWLVNIMMENGQQYMVKEDKERLQTEMTFYERRLHLVSLCKQSLCNGITQVSTEFVARAFKELLSPCIFKPEYDRSKSNL